jgi:glycosyltransferase involved in cell wall biosynthesis
MVVTGHGMYCENNTSKATELMFEKYKDSCYWINVSDYHKKDMDLNFFAKVPWGVDSDAFPFSPDGGDHLLFLSRMIKRKRPHFAIEVAELAGEKLTLAGQKGIEGSHVQYWTEIEHLFQKPHVTFTDHVPFDETYKFFGDAKALLLPLEIGEPMPVTSLEAMACGTPVIASNIPPMQEIIVDGVTGFLVDKDDKQAWVRAIKNISKIDRSDCRKHFEANFTWKKMAENYTKVYEDVKTDWNSRNEEK